MNNNFKAIVLLVIMCCSQSILAGGICKEIFTGSSDLICKSEIVGKCLNKWPIDYRDKDNRTLLHKASMHDNCIDTMRMLIEKDEKLLTSKDSCEMTPFMHARARCDIGASELLLEKGANPYEAYLANHFIRSCASCPKHPMSCSQEYERLLDKYKAKRKTYDFLSEQVDKKDLAWLVESDLDFKNLDSLSWYEQLALYVLKHTPANVQVKTIGLFKNLNVDYEYFSEVVGYSSPIKHVGIKFYNGSTFSYIGSDPMIVEESMNMSKNHTYDLLMDSIDIGLEYGALESLGPKFELTRHKAKAMKKYLAEDYYAKEFMEKVTLNYMVKNIEECFFVDDICRISFSTKTALEYELKNRPEYFSEMVEFVNNKILLHVGDYEDRKHGRYRVAFDAKLMEEAINITRKEWDARSEYWYGFDYDLFEHSCQSYVYDAAINVYLGLGGLIFLKR